MGDDTMQPAWLSAGEAEGKLAEALRQCKLDLREAEKENEELLGQVEQLEKIKHALVCEICESEKYLKVGVCLSCWNKSRKELRVIRQQNEKMILDAGRMVTVVKTMIVPAVLVMVGVLLIYAAYQVAPWLGILSFMLSLVIANIIAARLKE